MARYTVNGMKVYIAQVIALTGDPLTSSSFSGATWTRIKGLIDLADLGDTMDVVKTNYIDFDRVETLDGILDGGTKVWRFGLDDADAGQIAARAAAAVRSSYMMQVELTDKPTGVAPTNSFRRFAARLHPVVEGFGTANNQQIFQMSLSVNSNIVPIAATTGS